MTVIDHPARAKACARGELAARMVSVAQELACLVRDEGPDAIGKFLDGLAGGEKDALLIVQAAMIPDDRPAADLLSWVTWDEYRRDLPGPVLEEPAPQRMTGPPVTSGCGTYAAFRRHEDRGELIDDDCEEAARAYWRESKRRQRRNALAAAQAGPASADLHLAPITDELAAQNRADLEQALKERGEERRHAA